MTQTGEGGRPVTVNLVDEFEVWCGGERVRMALGSQRLVGFIALHDRPVRRCRVSGSLWPDTPEGRAGASLRSALWRTPTPGGTPVVVATATHLSLGPQVEVDFRTVVNRAQAILDGDDLDVDTIDLGRELCSYGDDLLAGWYDDWLLMERERFRHLRLQALDRLAERLCAYGRLHEALQVALTAVRTEPLRETSHRIAMRIHLIQGNVADAVRQYLLYERALRAELGVEPSAAMRRLLDECTETSPALARPRTCVA